jgi:hypothetical protein
MTIEIINMTAAGAHTFTATANTAVTDIVMHNTDPDPGSGFEWKMHIVKSGGTPDVNNQIYDTVSAHVTPTGFAGSMALPPVLFVGSTISINTFTGSFSEKWLLETGDKIAIVLDDTSVLGLVGSTIGSANASVAWGATPALVPVNLYINHILV